MPNPAAVAAARIFDEITGRKGFDFEIDRATEIEILGAIQEIIEEEMWGKMKEEHHGPKNDDYMKRALKNQ